MSTLMKTLICLIFLLGCSEKKEAGSLAPGATPNNPKATSASQQEEHVSGNESPTEQAPLSEPGHISGNEQEPSVQEQDSGSSDPHISGN